MLKVGLSRAKPREITAMIIEVYIKQVAHVLMGYRYDPSPNSSLPCVCTCTYLPYLAAFGVRWLAFPVQ